jgi:leucyl-tRNA synthetase
MKTLKEIWEKRQKIWQDTNIYQVKEDNKHQKKFYILDMFPYPSGAGLHVGHPKWFIASDVLARKKMLEGFSVLHPMGFDTFGLGTENYAIEHKMKPQIVADKNIKTYMKQLEMFGCTYDWDRSVNTADPEYFRWTQWIFLQLYTHYYDQKENKAKAISELEKQLEAQGKAREEIKQIVDGQRLAYIDYKPINRCPKCMTGLANEDLDEGTCERCGSEVEQKPMRQRVLRITKYAERLLSGLDNLNWDESMKELERNWIGKSEGTQFTMNIKDSEDFFEVYTTRIDTVFGMSFVVMAPEHPLVDRITTADQKDAVEKYKEQARHKSQLERTELQKEKTGQFSWAYAINPFNGEEVPVYIGDYVLANYGTGVVMAVPAHDERDFEFAKKYGIKIVQSIAPENKDHPEFEAIARWETCYPDKWILVNSWEFSGLTSDEAIAKMQEWLAEKGLGGKKCNYKIQDWVFSRQRYWGEPFPVVFCDHCESKGSIHFYNQDTWKGIETWSKTIETRALNPEEPERFFGNYKEGDIITAVNKETQTTMRLCIKKIYQWKNLNDMWENAGKDVLEKIYWNKKTFEETKTFEDFAAKRDFKPGYIEKIEQNGIVGWEIEKLPSKVVPMKESDLPLLLPDVENYAPTGTEEGPLAAIDEWMNVSCPACGKSARRESNTMPGWAWSSWYWLRYMDNKNTEALVSPEREQFRGSVDVYVGGAEHVTRHMIYARFWQKFLKDIGVVSHEEPFQKYHKVGLIMAEDGRKMSKRWGNVVLPDSIVDEYGSDTLRTYEMFMGPFEQSIAWSTNGIKGVKKFLDKIIALKDKIGEGEDDKKVVTILHQSIKKLTEDIDNFRHNTAVSQLMILVNFLTEQETISRKVLNNW